MDMESTFFQESSSIPFLISWNITKRCNLQCAHCYLDAGEIESRDDISTAEARLNQVLVFLSSMVKRGVEGHAKFKGIKIITPGIMSELRKRAGR